MNTKQKHCKRLTNYFKKHYKTQSFQTNQFLLAVCYLNYYNHKKMPTNVETLTMSSTREQEKNCICLLTNIKMSCLDMTQDPTYHMRCKRGRLHQALLMGPYWWWARWRYSLVMGSWRVAVIWFWSSGRWGTHSGWQLVRITGN